MRQENIQKQILEFLKTQDLGVISTISPEGLPDASVVGISEKDNFSLIFGTFKNSSKYRNIKKNNHVAFAIGWDEKTLQYLGRAKELMGEERERAKQLHIKKLPSSEKFANLPEQAYFNVSPLRIKFTDYSRNSIYGEAAEIEF